MRRSSRIRRAQNAQDAHQSMAQAVRTVLTVDDATAAKVTTPVTNVCPLPAFPSPTLSKNTRAARPLAQLNVGDSSATSTSRVSASPSPMSTRRTRARHARTEYKSKAKQHAEARKHEQAQSIKSQQTELQIHETRTKDTESVLGMLPDAQPPVVHTSSHPESSPTFSRSRRRSQRQKQHQHQHQQTCTSSPTQSSSPCQRINLESSSRSRQRSTRFNAPTSSLTALSLPSPALSHSPLSSMTIDTSTVFDFQQPSQLPSSTPATSTTSLRRRQPRAISSPQTAPDHSTPWKSIDVAHSTPAGAANSAPAVLELSMVASAAASFIDESGLLSDDSMNDETFKTSFAGTKRSASTKQSKKKRQTSSKRRQRAKAAKQQEDAWVNAVPHLEQIQQQLQAAEEFELEFG
eukprot:m.71024 g.71024  ORF g.71024 m.71024 type:complete len:406 (+) comp12280_c0_seq3:35-1252(+)